MQGHQVPPKTKCIRISAVQALIEFGCSGKLLGAIKRFRGVKSIGWIIYFCD